MQTDGAQAEQGPISSDDVLRIGLILTGVYLLGNSVPVVMGLITSLILRPAADRLNSFDLQNTTVSFVVRAAESLIGLWLVAGTQSTMRAIERLRHRQIPIPPGDAP